jgi:NADPH:quinone reductase-like Zn-dependent oxidoreductase
MKAVVYEKYGSPNVLQLTEVAKPVPKDDEVLIKVFATTVSTADCIMRRGKLLIGRIIMGLRKPGGKYKLLGMEFAGIVEAIGKDVKRFKSGDPVYGFRGFGTGALAEYKCMSEKESLEIKPVNLTFPEAASVVDGASTALFFLKDKAHLQRGQNILINGASGSVGSMAVQLAKYFGAEVTGVCSTANIELVKSLGADKVIDYTQEDFTKRGETYDIIFDAVSKSSFSRCEESLMQNGRYLVTNYGLARIVQTLWTGMIGGKKVIFAMSIEKKEAMTFLKGLFETGKIKPVIDRCYTMEQIVEAHAYVDKGHKKGNVVITVGHN